MAADTHSESEQIHTITQTKTYQLPFYLGKRVFTTTLYSAADQKMKHLWSELSLQ